MPIIKVKGGYKYGPTGKVYRNREDAAKQGRAIEASKAKRKKKKNFIEKYGKYKIKELSQNV